MKKYIITSIIIAIAGLFISTHAFDVSVDESSSDEQSTWYNRDVTGNFEFSGFSTFEWRYGSYGDWTPRGATCGTVTRSRTISGCYIQGTNTRVDDAACSGPKPGIDTETNNLGPCYDGTWRVYPPAPCNTRCGQSARTNRGSIRCIGNVCNPDTRPTQVASLNCPATSSCATACDAGGVATFSINDTNVGAYVEHDGSYVHPINRCVNSLNYLVTRGQDSDWPLPGTGYTRLENYPTTPRQVYSGNNNRLLLSITTSGNPGNCASGYKWVNSFVMTFEDYSARNGGVYGNLTGNASLKYTGCTAPPVGCSTQTIRGCTLQAGPNGTKRSCSVGVDLVLHATCETSTWKTELEDLCGNRGGVGKPIYQCR